MPPEAPFLFSIAGLSASLAGLAGLVAGLRRGPTLAAMELYRLREIVEFSFANVILALSSVVLPGVIDRGETVAVIAVAAFLYLVFDAAILFRRLAQVRLVFTKPWVVTASVIDFGAIVVGLIGIASRSVTALEVLLIVLLTRPMVAFLFVLASFEHDLEIATEPRTDSGPPASEEIDP